MQQPVAKQTFIVNTVNMYSDDDSMEIDDNILDGDLNKPYSLQSHLATDQQKPTLSTEQTLCLEEHKANYDGLITHYAKQLEYVEMLLQKRRTIC